MNGILYEFTLISPMAEYPGVKAEVLSIRFIYAVASPEIACQGNHLISSTLPGCLMFGLLRYVTKIKFNRPS
jgi:hypothetical protein